MSIQASTHASDSLGLAPTESLGSLRAAIELVDDQILAALARRFALAQAIQQEKQRAGQPVLDPAREAALVSRASRRARVLGLPEDEVRALYWRLLAASRRVQKDVERDEDV
ncbi:MAG: chorismate mutase [Gemmatimonadaceae bacterium]|nr:chorismate mutase [Gemmatimonadaceae bacterium]